MSAGKFERSRYQADNDEIHPIRVQEETLQANITGVNSAPGGNTTQSISAQVNKTNREFGLRPRFVTVKFTGNVPTGYSTDKVYRIPILTKARYNAINIGSTGSYLGETVQVISKTGENAK